MKKIVILYILTFVISFTMKAQSGEEKKVATAVQTLRKAVLDADKTNLDKVLAAELSYGHSNGKVEDKATFIDSYVSGKYDFVTLDLSEETIKIIGNTAIVRHKLKGETNDGGKAGSANLGVMLVWIQRQGAWKLVARQAYKL
jgi:ketosteroid isomerase-like protein